MRPRNRAGVPLYHTNVCLMCIGDRVVVIGGEAIASADRARVLEQLRASGRELIELDHAQLEQFAGNMLELGTWDEALGDSRVLVMSDSARRALPPAAVRAAVRLHGRGAGGAHPHHREVRRRERALHAGGSVPRAMIELLIKALLSYLLGSVDGEPRDPARHRRGRHPHLGSGNAGATNALRTQGKMIAFWVLVIDLAKGWIATGKVAPWIIPTSARRCPTWKCGRQPCAASP